MSEPSTSLGIAALFKAYGFKVAIGMIGAAMLYIVCPPVKRDGTFDQREFVARLACAGCFSAIFGDWAVAMFTNFLPSLLMAQHPAIAYLLVGAPAWWVSRAVALWFHKRRDKDIEETVRHVRKGLKR